MQKTFLPLSVAMLFLTACATEPPAPKIDLAAEQGKIRDAETTLGKEWAAKDAEKITAHYGADATLMTDGMDPIKGKEAIGTTLKGMMGDPNLKLEFTPEQVEVAQSGELGYSRGHYAMTMSDQKSKKPVTQKGAYLTVYKKDAAGSWSIVQDINSPGAK